MDAQRPLPAPQGLQQLAYEDCIVDLSWDDAIAGINSAPLEVMGCRASLPRPSSGAATGPPSHRQARTLLQRELVSVLPLPPQAALARADLWAEAALLERLLYKNRSQHRGSRHYKKLLEVRRLLRLLREAALPVAAAALHAGLSAARQSGALAAPISLG